MFSREIFFFVPRFAFLGLSGFSVGRLEWLGHSQTYLTSRRLIFKNQQRVFISAKICNLDKYLGFF